MSNRPPARARRAPALLAPATVLFLLGGCSGAASATPTAIPADVVRPAQSTPVLSTAQPQFRLDSATQEPVFVTQKEIGDALTPPPANNTRSLLRSFLMNQPPTAMGIAPGGATLLDAPGGNAVAGVPPAGALTITGRSADGVWLAAFTDDATAGWVPAGSIVLFGADDLTVVEQAFSPGPVATLISDAMTPVASPISVALTAQAQTPTPAAEGTPAPANESASDEESAAGGAAVGTVLSTGNLNLRGRPSTDGSVVASLRPRAQVVVLGRTEAGDWLQVRTPSGDGWVIAQFIELPVDAALPVVEP